jgi:hypothetical protein
MAKKMWRWSSYGTPRVKQFDVVKETAKQVEYEHDMWGKMTREREAKESLNHMWFDTWEECHDWMVGSAMIEMKNAEVQLGLARIKLSEIQSMQKPEVE